MLLAEHFLAMNNEKFGKDVEFDDDTKKYILQNHWPGNVRELQNAVSRYVVLGKLGSGFELDGKQLIDSDLGKSGAHDGPLPGPASDGEASEPGDRVLAPNLTHPQDGMTLKEIGRNAAREAERKAILGVLESTKWNKSQAAKILKISYKALLYKIKDCGIEKAES
jgi:two-component system response regulator AtoC